jgi:hypothetical protein
VMQQDLEMVTKARQLLLASLDFDLFADPIFVERYICKVCHLKQTLKQEIYDGGHESGLTVEIKYSALNIGTHIRRFAFQNLQGITGKGKRVDVYVLAGYVKPNLRYFVIPAHIIGGLQKIEIHIQERKYANTGKWLNYEVAEAHLERAIYQRGSAYRAINGLNMPPELE